VSSVSHADEPIIVVRPNATVDDVPGRSEDTDLTQIDAVVEAVAD